MSSLEAPSKDDDLPRALRSMWRLCKLGYQHEPALMAVAFLLALLAALPDALLAIWLKVLGDGARHLEHAPDRTTPYEHDQQRCHEDGQLGLARARRLR